MFSPSRDQVRQFFCTAWRKYQQQQPLEPMEQQAVAVILPHPEYRELLEDEAQALAREWPPEGGQMNPFLHLSLHLAIQEQLSIDQPPGIRDAYERLCRKLTDDHEAQHRLLECLGETVYRAQTASAPVDPQEYLAAVQSLAR